MWCARLPAARRLHRCRRASGRQSVSARQGSAVAAGHGSAPPRDLPTAHQYCSESPPAAPDRSREWRGHGAVRRSLDVGNAVRNDDRGRAAAREYIRVSPVEHVPPSGPVHTSASVAPARARETKANASIASSSVISATTCCRRCLTVIAEFYLAMPPISTRRPPSPIDQRPRGETAPTGEASYRNPRTAAARGDQENPRPGKHKSPISRALVKRERRDSNPRPPA